MTILLPLLVCLVGLVMYCISNNGKAQALGLDMFWVGLLAFLIEYPNAHLIVR